MKNKYLIRWDVGYGPMYEVVEAESPDEATEMAYEVWRDEAESNADYGIEEGIPEDEWEDYI